MSKPKNKITIDFSNGQSAEHVTGSAIYIKELNILLECGYSQSNDLVRDFRENNAKFNFSCKNLNHVFVGHAHLDHVGRIPLLYKRGCKAEVIVAEGNKEIIKNMLDDSVKINQRDAALLSKQKGHQYEPIYEQEDVDNAIAHIKEYPINEIIKLNDELSFRLTPSGHIKYGVQIELFITYKNVKKKLVYTSDLGNPSLPKYFSEEFKPIEKCDILIGEATYSDKDRQQASKKLRTQDLKKIESIIQTHCLDNKSRVLIPSFALDRTPELYMEIRNILKKKGWDIPILIDSPLAVKQFLLYSRDNPELLDEVNNSKTRLCSDYSESCAYYKMNGPMIILSSSGMMTAGRVLNYLPYVLSNEKSCILFCGYSSEGSLAWEIKNSKKRFIKIGNKRIANRASIVSLNSFSSHAQYNNLIDYYSSIQCDKIFLVHSQQSSKVKFAKELKLELEKRGKTTQVICVNKSTEGKL